MSRVRIRIQQRDGTCPTPGEACAPHSGNVVPFPRGQDVQVSIVNDDGTEERLRNVKRVILKARGRSEAVTCILELYNPVVDIELPMGVGCVATIVTPDPGTDGFLGERRL